MNNSAEKNGIKVFGVGGAGCNAVDFMARGNFLATSLIAVNTDAQSLASCAAVEKISLGAKLTYGLGAGGDADLGRAAAETDLETFRESCANTKIVFIICGLGGGTGTGAGSVLARAAKDSGALVLGIVTTPFDFEGGRRQRQAQLGLQQLKAVADAVICFPNQNLFKLIDEKTTVFEAFQVANEHLARGVAGIARLLAQTGLINVDFADVRSVTRNLQAESSFATVEANGADRAALILEKLFAHPMLEQGELLGDSDSILVSVAGGPDLAMAEVNTVMNAIKERCRHAHVIFGAAIEETLADWLSVTVIASGGKGRDEKSPDFSQNRRPALGGVSEAAPQLLDSQNAARPASRITAPAPELSEEGKAQLLSRQGGRPRKAGRRSFQGELPLEIISKGRFEKSEPTIHRGEDLDLPTYIRRGIPLN